MKKLYLPFILGAFILNSFWVNAQIPVLPGANLGITNMQAGKTKPPGWYYIQAIQSYQANSIKDANGNSNANAPLTSSILLLQQVLFVSDQTILNGHPGGSVLFPIVKNGATGPALKSINPNPFGDIAAGAFIQWYDRKLFNLDFSYQLGFNIVAPTGAFEKQYGINTGAHRYRVLPHFEFTLEPVKWLAISTKNNFYFYAKEIGSPDKPATAYDLNYALEFKLNKQLIVEAAGYYLIQLAQDSYNDNSNYYREQYNISDTRERVFAAGPGLGFTTPGKTVIELKGMWETCAKNRSQGFRSTLVLSFPL